MHDPKTKMIVFRDCTLLISVQPLKVHMDLLILSFGELSETNMVRAGKVVSLRIKLFNLFNLFYVLLLHSFFV